MKSYRRLAALLMLISGLRAAAGLTTAEQAMPQLEDILRQAAAQSPQMVSRALEVEIAEQGRIGQRAGMLPNLGGYYRYHQSREDRADQNRTLSVPKQYYDVSVTQPLFYWGERRNNARVGEIYKLIAEGNYRQGYRVLAQEVRAAYMRLILDKARVRRATLVRDTTRNQLKLGEQRLAQKVISDAQMFSIRITAERGEIEYQRAVFDLENDRQTFTRLTGVTAPTEAAIPDEIPAFQHSPEAMQGMLGQFLSRKDKPTQEAVNYLATIDIERLNLENQKTRLRPKFNLVAGISQDEQRYAALGSKYQVKSTYAGFSANWTVFDGFAARAGVRSSLARIRQMENEYKVLSDRLAQQAQAQARLAGFQAQYCSINDRYLDSAEGNLRAKREEFTRGVISEEEVTNAEIGLYDSRLNAYGTRLDYYTQVGEFLGTLAEDPVLANLSSGK